jgi:hypothetical protein
VTKAELTARVALGLTMRLFPSPHTLGDVRLLAQGRLHLWPNWGTQPRQAVDLVARFLACRPDEFAEEGPLLIYFRQVLGAADDFELEVPGAPDWSSTYRLVAGADLDARLDEWLSKLDKLHAKSSHPPEVKRSGAGDVELLAGSVSYRIPEAHLPGSEPRPLALQTSGTHDEIELDRDILRQLSRQIDFAMGGHLYERVAVEGFLERFLSPGGQPAAFVRSGPTKLAVAPTGAGKSVFARLVALHLASQRQPVALVVPDIQAVWREAIRLQRAADAAGLAVRIAPVSSWRNLPGRLAAHLDHPPPEDPDGSWALNQVAYTCLLSAYAEPAEAAPPMGQEPCTQLRQRGAARDTKVACPFSGQCGRFASFERALVADILVINHHAFLSGRLPREISVDGRSPRRVSTAEMVFRRCVAVFIDEIDGFQNTSIGAASRGLALSSRGKLSKPIQLYTEVERRRAEDQIDRSMRFERGRSALLRIANEAERLSELVNRQELDWPERGRMTWREAHDAWLAARLYEEDEEGLARVRRLYDAEAISGDERSECLRLALAPLGPGLGDGTLMEDVRAQIMRELLAWPLRSRRGVDPQQERDRLANRLILRAVLVQLDRALGHLRPQLPGLEQLEIQQAAELRDALLGYAPWQPSPVGPLGRRLFGYAFSQRADEQGALETRVMSGDPHGLVRELGGLVAHALAGTPRVVVGLSATCRFRGSPRSDVLGELLGSVRDESFNVRVLDATVQSRISGVGSRADRLEAAQTAARELWTSMLSRYLQESLARDDARGRARALLVTGSYDEAAAVARGLRQAAGPAVSIRYLVSDSAGETSDPDALPRNQLEAFGSVPVPAVLVGPLSVVARGHNILQPGTQLSALSGIFVLTRPVPPSHDADRFLAHLAYNAALVPASWRGSPGETLEAERREAWRRMRVLQRSSATFRHMDPELRRELVCDVLVELAQLAGRARRGGTPVDLVFVDGAFLDEVVPWSRLVRDVLDWWKERGWLGQMTDLHGAFVKGLACYALLGSDTPDPERRP